MVHILFDMADMDIAEVNKVRLSLGMKPLPVSGGACGPSFKEREHDESGSSSEEEEPGSTLESRQAEGYDNWKKLQDEADAKAKREAKAAALKKARDAAQSNAALHGKGLGDDDGDDLDTKTWLQQQKKRQKKLEKEKRRKLEAELAERENAPEYTEKDLAGVKVAHEMDDFQGGEEQVLTLKDSTIDQNEEEGDELENVDLRERDAVNERLDVKKKKPIYDPSAEADAEDGTILKQYDETIDGKKRKRFTLDGQGASVEERQAAKQAVSEKLKRQPISLDIINDVPISDYNEYSEPKIKKPRKSKQKSKRQKTVDEDEIFPLEESKDSEKNGDAMEVDAGNTQKPKRIQPQSFVDDDDLQASLAIQRREALKNRKKTKPEDIAKQLRREASATPGVEGDDVQESVEEGGLVIDETTEFVANLQRKDEERALQVTQPKHVSNIKMEASPDGSDEDVDMNRSYNQVEDDEPQARVKRENPDPAAPEITESGLEDEATLNKGLGATLNMLTQRGLVAKKGEDLNALHRDRERFLSEKQKREADIERKARAQRERDRASGKLDHMSARDREEYARQENRFRDQLESRAITEIFNREYKPDVQLKYVDEFGRSMNQKEAFKHLSHQFHGKGSGKQKTEKHLKKIEDDKKREAQSTLDASQATGLNNAMGATSKKNRQAGVRLA